MPQAICYISNTPILLSDSELDSLFTQTIEANTRDNITGILIYNEGTFLQLLEGNPLQVSALFETISNDPRHNQITKMMDRPIDERIFQEYRTGSCKEFKYRKMEALDSFIENNENSRYGRSVKAFLKPFLLIHS